MNTLSFIRLPFFSPITNRPPCPKASASASASASPTPTPTPIPSDEIKLLSNFRSRHNHIRVLEISRRSDSLFAGSHLLLLDSPGNIHSISFLFKPLTSTYFDVFATLPPILPSGPIALLGFGAGSAARLILHLYPHSVLHGWELDPAVISVAREFFSLSNLEKQYKDRLFIYVGDGLDAEIDGRFAGIVVDLFMKGSLVPELQREETWVKLKKRLRRGGRVMVNCGGSCVESEDEGRDGRRLMEETVGAMAEVFDGEVWVMRLGRGEEDSVVAVTGPAPDFGEWKGKVVEGLKSYVDMWRPYGG